MSNIDEKRVYSATEGKTDVFVATGAGVARVECSGDLVGGFGLIHRCVAHDIAVEGDQLAVATDEDVLVWNHDGFNSTGFNSTGFGLSRAVGYADELIAAGQERIARLEDGWNDLGVGESENDRAIDVRSIDGDLLAAASGVYRLETGENRTLFPVGLNDARDVSATPVPLVATSHGLYQLKNGWVNVLAGDVYCIESDGMRIHAATDEALYVHNADGEWEPIDLPVAERIAGIGYGYDESIYAVTVDGTFLLTSGDGWHARSLGLPDVCGLAVR